MAVLYQTILLDVNVYLPSNDTLVSRKWQIRQITLLSPNKTNRTNSFSLLPTSVYSTHHISFVRVHSKWIMSSDGAIVATKDHSLGTSLGSSLSSSATGMI